MARTPCCDKNGLKKGPWTPEEDQKLIDYIHKHGYGNWRTLPKNAGLQRCGKSCRLRWTNYLRPDIKRGRFSFEEEEIIIQLHSILGNKWSAIATRLPGRTDNEIKNYWNTHIRKRLLRMGIDPVTHTPRLDLFTNSLYNSQINQLLAQPLLDPELLRLATSLISSHHQNQPPTASHQTQLIFDNQFPPNQLLQPPQQNIIHDLGAQWNSIYQDQAPNPTNQRYYNVSGSDQPVMDSSIFYSTDNNFSALATTPSSTYISSPTTMNSNSTTTTCVNEDERDIISYSCSDVLKFEIPDILDVSDFGANF